VNGAQMVALFHAFMAYHYGAEKRDLVKMDAEIARCIKAWPDNPVVVFLTGRTLTP
jgi:hypothetical protein